MKGEVAMKKVRGMRQRGLLDRIALQRMGQDIDRVLRRNREYRNAVKQQEAALEKLEKLGLKKSHRLIIDHVISADNHCGAMYGEVAYRLGMEDGIRLMSEIRGLTRQREFYF